MLTTFIFFVKEDSNGGVSGLRCRKVSREPTVAVEELHVRIPALGLCASLDSTKTKKSQVALHTVTGVHHESGLLIDFANFP